MKLRKQPEISLRKSSKLCLVIIWLVKLIHKPELEVDQLLLLLMMMVHSPDPNLSLELALAWMIWKEEEVLPENLLDQRGRAKLDSPKNHNKDHQLQVQEVVKSLS